MSWRQKVKKHVIGLMLLFVIFSMTFADDLAKNDYLTISPSIGYYYAVTPEYLFLISTEENYCEECPREYFRLDNDGWFYFFIRVINGMTHSLPQSYRMLIHPTGRINQCHLFRLIPTNAIKKKSLIE